MNAKNRGKKGSGRVKRREVESEDGWTVITHGMSKVSLGSSSKSAKKEKDGITDGLPNKNVTGLTAENLLSDFKKLQERWEDTALAKQIEQTSRNRMWNIHKAICIGIGSFSRDWQHRHRSMWQLVLFLAVISHMNTEKVQMYAQDPAFTALDTSFLELLDITTTATGIEEHISIASFVYSPFMDWFILLPIFLRDRDPVLYLGNEILDDYTTYAQTEEKKAKVAECNDFGKAFLSRRESIKLRDFEAGNGFEGMYIYFKSHPT